MVFPPGNQFLFFILFFLSWDSLAGETPLSDQILIPSFPTVLSKAMSRSLEAKRGILLEDQAKLSRELLNYDRFPRIGFSAALAGKHSEIAGKVISTRNQNVSADVTYDLFDFGRKAAKRSLADYEIKKQEMSLEEVSEALGWRMAREYLLLVSLAQLFSIAKENMKVSKERMAVTQSNYSKGLRPDNDLVAAKADFGEAKLSYERAKSDLLLEIKKIHLLMGTPLKDSTHDQDLPSNLSNLILRSPEGWERLMKTWGKANKSAAEKRRTVEKESLLASEEIIASSKRPNLGIKLNALQGKSTDNLKVSKKEMSYSGQLELAWDLPWPGQHNKEHEQISNKKRLIEVEDSLEQRARNDAAEMAMNRFALEKELWESVEQQVQLRTRQYDLTKRRYQVGKAGFIELSSSELELGRVRLERVRILNSLAQAALDLAESNRLKNLDSLFSELNL